MRFMSHRGALPPWRGSLAVPVRMLHYVRDTAVHGQKKTRSLTETTVEDLRGGVESRVGSVKKQAVDNWDKLEGIFEDRVARVLGRLGVPTAEDVNKLSERVAQLSKQVSAIPKSNGAKKPATRKTAARKPAAKKTAAEKKPASAN